MAGAIFLHDERAEGGGDKVDEGHGCGAGHGCQDEVGVSFPGADVEVLPWAGAGAQGVHGAEQGVGQGQEAPVASCDRDYHLLRGDAHVTRKKGGRLLLYVNTLYVLMLETGELVRPRTAEKRPILMTEDEEARARHAILRDLKLMAMKGLDLSGKLLQMCGPKFAAQATSALEEEESLLTEAADRAERASMPDWRRDAMEAGENWDDEHAPDRLPSPPSCSESDAEEEEAEEEVSAQMAD